MPSYGHLIGDRIITHYIKKSGIKMAYSDLPTVYYRCTKEGIYIANGEIPVLSPTKNAGKSIKLQELFRNIHSLLYSLFE